MNSGDRDQSIDYYVSRRTQYRELFESHAASWRPFLEAAYGEAPTEGIIAETRERHDALIATLPYIGGDENPMTRHLVRSTTSLALYLAMRARGQTAYETGHILYDAVSEAVRRMGPLPFEPLTQERVAEEMARAEHSQERRYPEDWVWWYIRGDGVRFDYGYDFTECGTQKLYHAHGADEFLPYYCYLDFVTHRSAGWGLSRTMTLSRGAPMCDFRWKVGRETRRGWPPWFAVSP